MLIADRCTHQSRLTLTVIIGITRLSARGMIFSSEPSYENGCKSLSVPGWKAARRFKTTAAARHFVRYAREHGVHADGYDPYSEEFGHLSARLPL